MALAGLGAPSIKTSLFTLSALTSSSLSSSSITSLFLFLEVIFTGLGSPSYKIPYGEQGKELSPTHFDLVQLHFLGFLRYDSQKILPHPSIRRDILLGKGLKVDANARHMIGKGQKKKQENIHSAKHGVAVHHQPTHLLTHLVHLNSRNIDDLKGFDT